MSVTIKLNGRLGPHEEQWLAKNVGPRLHYLHNSVGGQGWIARHDWTKDNTMQWTLTLENESYASFFILQFPQ
jgi:hypothetical protein